MTQGDSAERIEARPGEPWYEEHVSRYLWASRFLDAKVIIDAACGSGYGLEVLRSGEVEFVVGFDRSLGALRGKDQQLSPVACADVLRLPLVEDSVDAVTSFETIEHLSDAEMFLDELVRVLHPQGVLFLSSPNGWLTSKRPDGRPANRFHVREFLPEELVELLEERFDEVSLFGQFVSPDFGVCPYWDIRPRSQRLRRTGVRGLLWRVFSRLPSGAGEWLSIRILRQRLYPSAFDFVFVEEEAKDAHVFVVKAKGVRSKRATESLVRQVE